MEPHLQKIQELSKEKEKRKVQTQLIEDQRKRVFFSVILDFVYL